MSEILQQEHWITMNDGVRLDATVCTPAGSPPPDGWPAVLIVHGHGDAGCKVSCLARARRLAQRGYLTVAYSVRGQGASEGLSFHMGPREIFDLQDVVGWMEQSLPADAQRVAVCGSSQGGWHAYMAAIHCPQVATVVPENIFTDFPSFIVRNGCLNRWFFTKTMRRRIMTAGVQELTRRWALDGDWDLLRAWAEDRSPLNFVGRIRCPVFIVHGWHDVGMPPNEVVEMFQRLPEPKKLYLGAGGHDGVEDDDARLLREGLVDRWLDHWLLGRDTGILDEPAAVLARRPGWDHISRAEVCLDEDTVDTLYLHADGSLQAEPAVQTSLPSNINNFPIDPQYGLAEALRDDMEGVDAALAREEVAFDAPSTASDCDILGAPVAHLHILPNRPHVQVHAELYDVDGDGAVSLICRGHWGTRSAAAGQHMTVDIHLATICYRLAAGHRLRLVISNLNRTFAVPYFGHSCARLFHDAERSSRLSLPTAASS